MSSGAPPFPGRVSCPRPAPTRMHTQARVLVGALVVCRPHEGSGAPSRDDLGAWAWPGGKEGSGSGRGRDGGPFPEEMPGGETCFFPAA